MAGSACSRLHFVGILGSGMSSVAQFARWEGCEVSGSDRSLGSPDTRETAGQMERIGCRLLAQDGSGAALVPDAVVVSTAIETDNPDIAAARARGIPVVHRSDALAAIVRSRRTVAVAGTSGKSTVTALLFDCLEGCGKAPSVISGANLKSVSARGALGNAWRGESDLLVIEADESDGTIVKYVPYLSVVLNVSRDHKAVDETMAMFAKLVSQSQKTVVNAEDPLCSRLPHAVSFGLHDGAYRPNYISRTVPEIAFTRGRTNFSSPLAGEHNLSNALAALCACSVLGCDDRALAVALTSAGRLSRRFEQVSSKGSVTVIDDYAHNPAKIEAALRTAQAMARRVFAVFQPHGFGPLRFMQEELVEVLSRVPRAEDRVFLLPVYYAGGTAQRDISSADVATRLVAKGRQAEAPESRDACLALLRAQATAGDLVLVMGARDPSLPAFARAVAEATAGSGRR